MVSTLSKKQDLLPAMTQTWAIMGLRIGIGAATTVAADVCRGLFSLLTAICRWSGLWL